MARPTTPRVFEVFSGLAEDVGPEIGENQALRLENLYRRRGKLVVRGGTDQLYSLGSGELAGLQWCKLDAGEHLVAVYGSHVINLFNESPYYIVGGLSRFPSSGDVSAAWIRGYLILGNGTDQNVRYDGSDVRVAMVDKAPSGMTLELAPSAGNLTGTYKYRTVFRNADGIVGEPSDPSSGFTVTSWQIDITNIPQPSERAGDTTTTYLYRTKSNGGTYFFVAEITGTTYLDNIPDDELGSEILDDQTRMPPCRHLIEHENRLIGVNSDNEVCISNVREPWYCPILPDTNDPNQGTRIPLEDIAAGQITGLASHGQFLVVFTGGSMYLIQGTNPANFSLQVFAPHGCTSHKTIAGVHTNLIWLGPDGVYSFDGLNVVRISEDIRDTIDDLTAADMVEAHAFVWDNRYYLCYPGGAVYYDLVYQQWGRLTSWDWALSSVSTFTADERQRLYANKSDSAEVWQLETGTTDNGDDIPVVWESRDFDCGLQFREKRIHNFGAIFKKSTGTVTVSLFRGTGELIQSETHDLSDTDRPGASVSRFIADAAEGARDEFFRLKIECDTATSFELLSAEAHFSLAL